MAKGRKDKAAKSRRHPYWISAAFIVMACLLRSEKLQKVQHFCVYAREKQVVAAKTASIISVLG